MPTISYFMQWEHTEGSWPEWCISSMIYSRDTPFWSGTLDICMFVLLSTWQNDKQNTKKKWRGREWRPEQEEEKKEEEEAAMKKKKEEEEKKEEGGQ